MLPLNSLPTAAAIEFPILREIRVLLLDDSTFDRARSRRLGGGMLLPIQLDEGGSVEELNGGIRSDVYDPISVDFRLPVCDGMDALGVIQNNPHNRHAGKITNTGNGSLGTAVEAMRAGCHDFFSKDEIDANKLKPAMLNAMALVCQRPISDVFETKQYRDILREGLAGAFDSKHVLSKAAGLMEKAFLAFGTDHRVQGQREAELEVRLADLDQPDDSIFHLAVSTAYPGRFFLAGAGRPRMARTCAL